METVEIAVKAAQELAETLSRVDSVQVGALVDEIAKAKNVFVAGAGRSLLMLRGSAMRMMHLGISAHVVGDVTTPALQPGDLLVIGSGSGETGGTVNIAGKAKKFGGRRAVVTIFPESTLGKMADVAVRLPSYTNKLPAGPDNQPSTMHCGNVFEESLLILCDAVVETLAGKVGIKTDQSFSRHANLE